VAVIDTGIDYTHPDLSDNIWSDPVTSKHGIDVVNNDSDPMDDNQHGTHVAGTIGAVGNNGIGVVGVNWTVRLMACKFLNASGSGTTDGAIACLDYVKTRKEQGVNVVATNNSWGGGGFSRSLYDAINAHLQAEILFIAAAGNSALDNDTALFYPASYFLPNVIAVAASTPTDALASFSNFGRRTVHLGAPGTDIPSTMPGNKYGTLSGTSMATPHVTGVAVLLKAQDSNRDWRAIKNLILAGGDGTASLANTITGKRLNAYGALTCSDSIVLSRLRPIGTTITASAGTPIDLAALHINCGTPHGDVTVAVTSESSVTLTDNGAGADQAAGDGISSGQWTPGGPGVYTLTFLADNTAFDEVTVQVLQNYNYLVTSLSSTMITGTSLNLGDDSSAKVTSPFEIPFGGGTFTELYVSSNGNLNFMGPYTAYINDPLPTSALSTLVAPFWDDLYPVPGSGQDVYWGIIGGAPNRQLVIEWRDVRHYNCNADSLATVRFRVVFFEGSSDILFNYADTTFGGACTFADQGGSATVGVQVGSTSATQYSNALTPGTTLRWTLAEPGPDTTLPTVTITTPTVSPTYSTNSGPLTLGGTAGDNVGVTQVTWTNDRGGSETASGTTNWTVNGIPLQPGTNVLTVTAHDDAGNWATDTLTVVLDQTPPNDGSLTAIAGNAKVTLNWSAFSDDGSGLASTDPYKLVFSTGGYPAASCTSGSQLYTGSNTSFTHTKLKNGTLYYYRVCALDNAGNISTGVTVSAMPQGGKRR
jgi:hypothetical protein